MNCPCPNEEEVASRLHPEELPPSVLLRLLQERKVKIDNLERMSGSELVQIYKQFCLPHVQRKYRDTPRGKLLSKQQQEREKISKEASNGISNKLLVNNVRLNGGMDIKRKLSDMQLTEPNESNKRKYTQMSSNDVNSEQSNVKKQKMKITWP